MNFPENLQYTKEHEWVSAAPEETSVGISEYALDQLGDIVFVELPNVGDTLTAGESFGTIESTKTVSDLYSPGGGEVVAINEGVVNSPESIKNDPYKEGWLIKIKLTEPLDSSLMSAKEYAKFVAESE